MNLKEFLSYMGLYSFNTINRVQLIAPNGNALLSLNQESVRKENYREYGSWKVGSFAVVKEALLVGIRK